MSVRKVGLAKGGTTFFDFFIANYVTMWHNLNMKSYSYLLEHIEGLRKQGKYLFIKKDAPVIAEVDYVNPNGWASDSAYIQIKKFKILDSKNKWLDVQFPLKILGRNCKNPESNIVFVGIHYLTTLFRGDEVFLVPNQQNFNILIWN